MDLIQSQEPKAGKDANINEDEENEVWLIGGDEKDTAVMQSIKCVEDAWDDG
jgi:hypothetical protein